MTMEDCVALARDLGARVGRGARDPRLLLRGGGPAAGAPQPGRVRQGEYEGLAEKLKDPEWAPDCGPAVFNPKSGATIIGAREFLIAYNINLNTRDRKLATEIALNIRESGRAQRDEDGDIVRDENGSCGQDPGPVPPRQGRRLVHRGLRHGPDLDQFHQLQGHPVHVVFDEVRAQAAAMGLRVTGSELVGLIPKDALLAAGRYYLERQGKKPRRPRGGAHPDGRPVPRPERRGPVRPGEENHRVPGRRGRSRLVRMDLREFADELSMDSPAPGGGSVAAFCGALSAGLSAMVANLTVGKKGYEKSWAELEPDGGPKPRTSRTTVSAIVDLDTAAFNKVMDAFRLAQGDRGPGPSRDAAVEDGDAGSDPDSVRSPGELPRPPRAGPVGGRNEATAIP